jgi:hypothetical protein
VPLPNLIHPRCANSVPRSHAQAKGVLRSAECAFLIDEGAMALIAKRQSPAMSEALEGSDKLRRLVRQSGEVANRSRNVMEGQHSLNPARPQQLADSTLDETVYDVAPIVSDIELGKREQ